MHVVPLETVGYLQVWRWRETFLAPLRVLGKVWGWRGGQGPHFPSHPGPHGCHLVPLPPLSTRPQATTRPQGSGTGIHHKGEWGKHSKVSRKPGGTDAALL